jgi:hypothetical protein
MYIDLFPGAYPPKWDLWAHSNPSSKNQGNTRIAFDVTIPDELLFQIDAYAPEVSAVEVLK